MKSTPYLLSLCLLLGSASSALAAEPPAETLAYTDVSPEHWAYSALNQLAARHGLRLGYPDGSFRGEQAVTRYEMAALILRLLQKMPAAEQKDAEIQALKTAFASEISSLQSAQDEALNSIYDRLDLIEVQAMEQSERLRSDWQEQLPFRLSGDFGVRYEHLASDITDFDSIVSSTPQTRLTLSLDSLDQGQPFLYGARLSTGDLRNPANPWWRLGDFGARVGVGLDRFFVTWRPLQQLELTAGKFANRYSNSELLMDLDVQPEGAMQRLHFSDILPFWSSASLLLGQSIFNMNGLYQDNTFMLSAKGDSRFDFTSFSLEVSAAYHHYLGTDALYSANQIARENNLAARVIGNAMNNTDGSGFAIGNAFSALTWQITPTLPLRLEADYLRNFAATERNQALQAKVSLGALRQPGDWQLAYFFKHLEADASVSYFVEDQLLGTDVSAHEGQVALKLWEQTTWFLSYQYSSRLSAPDSTRHTLRTGFHQRF